MHGGRAVGGPVALGLVASLFAIGLAGWLAAAILILLAAPDLAHGHPLAARPVLAAHLVALGLLPFAVTGGALHLLPVMLRNDVRRPRLLHAAVPLLCGGFLAAPGIAYHAPTLLWPGVALVALGLALVLWELASLVVAAPGDRMLVVSRTGVALSLLHVVAALVLGALLFAHGDHSLAGVGHDRWLLVHLHLAVIGWLALLIVTVGRTLAPMLAQAPTMPQRRLPVDEFLLVVGLWVLVAGVAADSRASSLAGGALVVSALVRFGHVLARVARTTRIPVEGPLAHFVIGVVFLVEAAVVGVLVLFQLIGTGRGVTVYVFLLLVGWAANVTLGHLGKLLSLSIWVWWPPGPRPKQAALYPRGAWLTEAAAFGAGSQLVAAGVLAAASAVVYAGGALLCAAAAIAVGAASRTWLARAR
ncbi:MAG: hypothetical protein ACYDA3_04870 [Gaiellaceae bacterium]